MSSKEFEISNKIRKEIENKFLSLRQTRGWRIYQNEKYKFDRTDLSSSTDDGRILNPEASASSTFDLSSPMPTANRGDYMEYSFSPFSPFLFLIE